LNKSLLQYRAERYTETQNEDILRALEFSTRAHESQLRASGEAYIAHPIAVAQIVASWGLDYEAVIAALLHDVVEDTPVTLAELASEFGDKVAELVDGVTKLRLSATPRPAADSARRAASNENLRKLLLASSRDMRVLLIKLADRLHNMRTLGYLPSEKRARIARESLEIFGPIADRLGMGQLKGELEDLGFRFSKPDEYADLVRRVKTTASKSERYLAVLKRTVTDYLEAGGVEVLHIEGRQKHYYSIYKKLIKVDGDIEKIYDLIAVRIIVSDVAACYQALGIVHQHYKPLIYRIKDYIAVPKANGYQSLHTTVFADDGKITEIQIRTPEMHEAAEYGLAAHFYYDSQKMTADFAKRVSTAVPKSMDWVKDLAELQQSATSGQDFVDEAKLDLFAKHIFVFSPLGDLYDLPEGSTPLDFAFAVHSQVGLRALGSKVNGRMAPLDAKLENRDVVEIITRRESAPSRDWLGFVVTSHAKARLRSWFRNVSRDSNIVSGRGLLEAELQPWGIKRIDDLPKRAMPELIDVMHIKSIDDLYAQLGEGSLNVEQVIRRLIPDAAKPKDAKVIKRVEPTGRVLVEGVKLPYTLAACCNPVFPESLVGFVTRGKGVTVHAEGCSNLPNESERYTTCYWETSADGTERVVCNLQVISIDRIGLVSDITGILAARKLRIAGMSSGSIEKPGQCQVNFGLEVPDLFVLSDVIRRIERLPGVLRVTRVG
jgi:guanosine-3',5'-bis(diphosphate) 3'-pyrophosphohydrolase